MIKPLLFFLSPKGDWLACSVQPWLIQFGLDELVWASYSSVQLVSGRHRTEIGIPLNTQSLTRCSRSFQRFESCDSEQQYSYSRNVDSQQWVLAELLENWFLLWALMEFAFVLSTAAAAAPDRPFHNFVASKSIARRSWTTYKYRQCSDLEALKLWEGPSGSGIYPSWWHLLLYFRIVVEMASIKIWERLGWRKQRKVREGDDGNDSWMSLIMDFAPGLWFDEHVKKRGELSDYYCASFVLGWKRK